MKTENILQSGSHITEIQGLENNMRGPTTIRCFQRLPKTTLRGILPISATPYRPPKSAEQHPENDYRYYYRDCSPITK